MKWLCSLKGMSAVLLAAALAVAPLDAAAQEGDAPPEATAESSGAPEGVQEVVVAARGGFGKYNETTIQQNDTFWTGGLVSWWQQAVTSRLWGEVMFSGYDRVYVLSGVGTPGNLPAVQVNEFRVQGALTYAYNVLASVGMGGWLGIGWRHDYFTNDQFSRNLTGAIIRADFEWWLTEAFALDAFVDYTYNILSLTNTIDDTALSFTGDLIGSLRWGAGFDFLIGGVTRVGVGYVGEQLAYDKTDLFFHQAMLEVGVPIRF